MRDGRTWNGTQKLYIKGLVLMSQVDITVGRHDRDSSVLGREPIPHRLVPYTQVREYTRRCSSSTRTLTTGDETNPNRFLLRFIH